MDPVEKAIRNALEKGDAGDRTFREKVYRSALAALERATKSQPQLTVEMAIKRRQHLQATVTRIESEYLPSASVQDEPPPVSLDAIEAAGAAPSGEAPSTEAPSIDAPSVDAHFGNAPEIAYPHGSAGGSAPSVSLDLDRDTNAPEIDFGMADARPDPRSDFGPGSRPDSRPDSHLASAGDVAAVAPDRDERRARRRKRPFAALFLAATVLSAIAIGGWWAYQTGLLGTSPTQEAFPRVVDEEDFDPAVDAPLQPGGTLDTRNWITIFSPGDPSGVNAPTGASAEVKSDESGSFIRIRSGTSGAAIVFDIGQGILERIAGRRAVFDISARAEEGVQTQISVSCDFGELGDCGRKRYAVGYERGDYLFDTDLPANRPGAGGSIAVISDFANEGRAIDIYEIKVSVVD